MQLKAEVWVAAYRRTCSAAGAFATIVHHGDDDYGQVLIKVHDGAGRCRLFEPVSAHELADRDDRRWREVPPIAPDPRNLQTPPQSGAHDRGRQAGDEAARNVWCERDCDASLAARRRSDPDVWVVDVLDTDLADHLGDWRERVRLPLAWPPEA